MKKHTCKNCGKTYEYCRGCLLSPISYKEAGYCSKTCFEESKAPKIEEVIPVVDVEVVVEEDTSTSEEDNVEYPYFFAETTDEIIIEESQIEIEIQPKKKKNKNAKKEKNIYDYEQSNPENI